MLSATSYGFASIGSAQTQAQTRRKAALAMSAPSLFAALRQEERFELRGGNRLGEVIALYDVAAERL